MLLGQMLRDRPTSWVLAVPGKRTQLELLAASNPLFPAGSRRRADSGVRVPKSITSDETQVDDHDSVETRSVRVAVDCPGIGFVVRLQQRNGWACSSALSASDLPLRDCPRELARPNSEAAGRCWSAAVLEGRRRSRSQRIDSGPRGGMQWAVRVSRMSPPVSPNPPLLAGSTSQAGPGWRATDRCSPAETQVCRRRRSLRER